MVHALAVWALFITAAVSLQLFLYLRGKNNNSRSLFYLTLFLAASAWWALWNAFEYIIPGLGPKLFATNLQYMAIPTIPVLWYSFGRSFDREERAGGWGRDPHWAIWIVPGVTAVLVWFDPLIGLVRNNIHLAEYNGFLYIMKDYGPCFWVMWVYSYVFVVFAIIFILRGILAQEKTNKLQVTFLVVGVLFPTIANFVYVIGFSSASDIDPTPIAFSLTAFFLIVNLKRFRFLPFVGAAREKALEELRDAVLIFDRESILVYANPAAKRFLNLQPEHIGKKIDKIGNALLSLSNIRVGEERELILEEQRHIEARASAIS
ncbi:MAG: histidine kinase N-terminal 7TM domain-containing protein, partial [Treponemataceae bacterium]